MSTCFHTKYQLSCFSKLNIEEQFMQRKHIQTIKKEKSNANVQYKHSHEQTWDTHNKHT